MQTNQPKTNHANSSKNLQGKMDIMSMLRNILPYIRPYKWLISTTLVLTLISSLLAQVNAIVLDKAVDSINDLLHQPSFA